jgi:hypothetical protein
MSNSLSNWLNKVSTEEHDDAEAAAPIVTEGGETAEAEAAVTEPVVETPTDPNAESQTEEQLPEEGAAEDDTVSTESEDTAFEADVEDEHADVNAQMNEVASDMDRIEKVSTALECYADLLNGAIVRDGYVSPDLARAVSIGLEAFEEESVTGLVASVENFNDPAGRYTVSVEALDNVKKRLGDMVKVAKAAIIKLFEILQDLWNGIVNSTAAMQSRLETAREAVKALDKRNTEWLEIKGGSRLAINGEFVGTTLPPIHDLAVVGKYMAVDYHKTVGSVVEELITFIDSKASFLSGRSTFQTMLVGCASIINDKLRFNGMPVEDCRPNEVPSKFKKFTKVRRSKALYGDRAMFFAVNDAKGEHDIQGITTMRGNLFDIGLDVIPTAKPLEGVTRVKVPEKAALLKLIDELEKLVQLINDSNGSKANADKIRQRLTKSIEKYALIKGDVLSGMFLTSIMQQFAKIMSQPSGNFLGYMATVIKAHTMLLGRYVEHHSGAKFTFGAAEEKDDSVIEGERGFMAPAVRA